MSVTIDTVSSHGEGVCLTHKPPIFIDGALPHETLDVQIIKKNKSHWKAQTKLKTIKDSHPQRVEPFCGYFERCGGCTTQHCHPQAMLQFKQSALDSQFKKVFGDIQLPWLAPIQTQGRAYRRKARLAIDARNPKAIKLGFRSAGSSDIVTIETCPILETELQAMMHILHIQIVKNANCDKNNAIRHVGHITLLKADDLCSVTVKLVKDLNEKGMLWWQTVQHKLNEAMSNDVLLSLVQPSETIKLANTQSNNLRTTATDFIQVNESVNRDMIKEACAELFSDSTSEELANAEVPTVLDLFCGLGNFTFALSTHARKVTGVEGSEEMVRKAKAIALKSGAKNIKFICRDLNAVTGITDLLGAEHTHVLLDPSREGALAVCKQLHANKVSKIVYISCNPQTWQRDANVLLDKGYSLSKLMLMDMFPYTPHSELFSVFTQS